MIRCRSQEPCRRALLRRLQLLRIGRTASLAAFLVVPALASAQSPVTQPTMPANSQAPVPATQPAQIPQTQQQPGAAAPLPSQPPMPEPQTSPVEAPVVQPPSLTTPPVAIVPLDMAIPGSATAVSGSTQTWKGRAYITTSGAITAGEQMAQVTLPYRGTLRVCPSTTVRLAIDTSVSAKDVPGLLMGLEGGAIETSFAITRNSDQLLTPNFRIMIAGPGASELKVRLGVGGDTCIDNSGANAPYVVVTSVFDSGLYRVQPGQRVMFEHGDLHTVVDDEKEPCGCPPPGQKANEFPLAQSEGLAPPPVLPPTLPTTQPAGSGAASTTLVYNGSEKPAQTVTIPPPPPAPQTAQVPASQATQPAAKKKPGVFRKIGRFFKKVFGAESSTQQPAQ